MVKLVNPLFCTTKVSLQKGSSHNDLFHLDPSAGEPNPLQLAAMTVVAIRSALAFGPMQPNTSVTWKGSVAPAAANFGYRPSVSGCMKIKPLQKSPTVL